MSNAPPLTGRLRSAQITLMVASASHDIWWTYAAKGTRDLEAMNSFPSFFLYDEEAHFRNMIVGLYTLYDSYAETLTIKSLIRELDPQAAKPIWRRYNAVQDAVKKVTYLRHNAFAHRAAGKDYRGIFEEAGLRPDDLKALITGSLDLLGMIADAIGAEPMLLPSLTYETTRLLNRIKTADTA